MSSFLFDLGRIGMGFVFLISVFFDYKTKAQILALMAPKKLPKPNLLFLGGVVWKVVTSVCLILNFYTFWAALLLALYIFIANFIFNSFWSAPKEQRDLSLSIFMICLASCFGLLAIAGAIQ